MIDCFKDIDLNKIDKLHAMTSERFHVAVYYDILSIVSRYMPNSYSHKDTQLTNTVCIETYNLLDLERYRHKIGKMHLLCKNVYVERYEKYIRQVTGIYIELGQHKFEIDILQKGYTEDMFEHMKSSIKERLIEAVASKKLMRL